MSDRNAEKSLAPVDDGGQATKARRKRGTGFPVVPLSEAAKILKEAGKYGFEHSAHALAGHMGHSTATSGAFRQRLAAFRDWKLLSGRGETLAMTETARMIAMPTGPEAERRALREAFRSCGLFARLYDQSAKGRPLKPGQLGTRAVHDFGVAPDKAGKFAKSFVESAVAADLAERNEDGDVILRDPQGSEDSEAVPPESTGEPLAEASGPIPARSAAETKTAAPAVSQLWPIDGGEILFQLRSARALPAAAFASIGEVVAKLEVLAGSLRDEQPADQTEADHVEDEVEL